MAKALSSITGGKLLRGKSSKEKKFINKHAVYDEDPNQHNNDIAKKIKMDNRNPYHGYNPGQDEAVYEGFYKDKDIARQEAEYAKKHHPKSIMMDKIADMHKKGKLSPEAKAIALRHMKKMTNEEVFENWEMLEEAMQQYQKDGLKAFSHIMTGKKGKKGSVQYTGVNLKQSFPHKDKKGNVSHLANPNKARWSHPEDRVYFEKQKKASRGFLSRLFGGKKKSIRESSAEYFEEANKLTRAIDKYSGNKEKRINKKLLAKYRKRLDDKTKAGDET